MNKSETASHLSIGEVLSLLQDEFPDVTISKIRFLESQGLIDPERTPSGYRKFYDGDVARLRWVLRQQRDNFLPLKVIKSKIESGVDTSDDSQQSLFVEAANPDPTSPSDPVAGDGDAPTDNPAPASTPTVFIDAAAGDHGSPDESASVDGGIADADPGAWLAALQEGVTGRHATIEGTVEERLSAAELARMADVSREAIDDLVEYALLVPIHVAGEPMFDASCVAVVKATREFFDHGVTARHLRIFKNSAEREAGFHEQLILPLLKQRNPKARTAAVGRLKKLTRSGTALHKALVQQALRSHLGG